MERKVGEIFECNGEWYQCGEGRCRDCYFSEERYLCKQFITKGFCTSGIIFKKLEKVGEPFFVNIQGNNVLEQRYKLYEPMVTLEGYWYRIDGNFINIEIKQTKEDMEEKNGIMIPKENNQLTRIVYNYVNGKISDKELIKSIKEMSDEYPYNKNSLKPFDLKAAKAGKPVCTRDGRKAIFLTTLSNKNFPVVAIVCCGQEENVYQYDINGVCDEHDDNLDLMMLPEKKEGWVNIYRDYDEIETGIKVYDTESEAKKGIENNSNSSLYLDTIKITWEE